MLKWINYKTTVEKSHTNTNLPMSLHTRVFRTRSQINFIVENNHHKDKEAVETICNILDHAMNRLENGQSLIENGGLKIIRMINEYNSLDNQGKKELFKKYGEDFWENFVVVRQEFHRVRYTLSKSNTQKFIQDSKKLDPEFNFESILEKIAA